MLNRIILIIIVSIVISNYIGFKSKNPPVYSEYKVYPRPVPRPAHAPRKVNPKEAECLALNTYHEARGESLTGQIAVMDVVLNRVKSKRYPNTVCDVVWQITINPKTKKKVAQFSWTLDGRSDIPHDTKAYNRLIELATQALRRFDSKLLPRAVLYHARNIRPRWANSTKIKRMKDIGMHIFYAYNG